MDESVEGAKSTVGIRSHVNETIWKEGEDSVEPDLQHPNTPFSHSHPTFFNLPLFNLAAIKLFFDIKMGEDICPPFAPPPPPQSWALF